MRFTVKSDLLQFSNLFAHGITIEEFDAGIEFATFPSGWSGDRVHVLALSRFAREVWFRSELMEIIELEPTK